MSRTPSNGTLVAVLIGQLAFGLLAMTICIPSMQEWGAIFGTGQSTVQLTFSGFVVAYGVLQLVYGPLSDRLGRRRILLAGLALAGLGSAWGALTSDIQALTAARILQGAGSAAGMVVGRAMVQDLFDGAQRTRVMAWIGMAMGLCPPLATVIGGQLHVRLGWQANFVVMAALALVLWLAAWRVLPAHERPAGTQPHWLRAMAQAYARLAREPVFLLYTLILSMTAATFYQFLAGAPMVLGHFGVGPDRVGFFIMCIPLSYIVGNFITSRLAHRAGDARMMLAGHGCTVSGIALALALAWAGHHSPLAFTLPLLLLGFGHGLLMPPTLGGTVGVVPALAGSAAAVAGLMQQMMGALGGYLVGLVPHTGAVNLSALMLASALLGAAGLWGLRRLRPAPRASLRER